MKIRFGGVAGGVLCLALSGLAATGRGTVVEQQATPDQPRFVNARVETRQAADLAGSFRAAVAGMQSPGWVGYSFTGIPGDRHSCESDWPSRVYLEGRPAGGWNDAERGSTEGSRQMAILFRVEAARAHKLRVFSTGCEVDAGALPVVWLTGVRPADSVALLRGMVSGTERQRGAAGIRDDALMMAIALHADASAQQALEAFVAPGQPAEVRKRAAFWLGAARGNEGFAVLKRLVATEPDASFRRELVFPLSLSRNPESAEALIGLARSDESASVRKQAMFWLGQKAGAKVASTLTTAAATDPDTEVKKQAVFGLSRMPNGEGVPHLIEVARGSPNVAVKKQALFWLGQSNDPRALAYLEEVVKK